MRLVVLTLISLILPAGSIASDSGLAEQGSFLSRNIGETARAYPGDEIFSQIDGYTANCWILQQPAENRYCTVSSGTYCALHKNWGRPQRKESRFTHIETPRAVGTKHLSGSVSEWISYVSVKTKKKGVDFKCPNFTSFSDSEVSAKKSNEILGLVQSIEFLGKVGDTFEFLYEASAKPAYTNDIFLNKPEFREQIGENRTLRVDTKNAKSLFYRGVVIEILNYSDGELEFKVKRGFKN